jgi:hypothetical protein
MPVAAAQGQTGHQQHHRAICQLTLSHSQQCLAAAAPDLSCAHTAVGLYPDRVPVPAGPSAGCEKTQCPGRVLTSLRLFGLLLLPSAAARSCQPGRWCGVCHYGCCCCCSCSCCCSCCCCCCCCCCGTGRKQKGDGPGRQGCCQGLRRCSWQPQVALQKRLVLRQMPVAAAAVAAAAPAPAAAGLAAASTCRGVSEHQELL